MRGRGRGHGRFEFRVFERNIDISHFEGQNDVYVVNQ